MEPDTGRGSTVPEAAPRRSESNTADADTHTHTRAPPPPLTPFTGFVLLQLLVVPVIVSVLLTKWGIATAVSGASAAARSCLAVLCRRRVAVSAAQAAAAAAAAAAAEAAGRGGSSRGSPEASPRADEVSSLPGTPSGDRGDAAGRAPQQPQQEGRPMLTAYKRS